MSSDFLPDQPGEGAQAPIAGRVWAPPVAEYGAPNAMAAYAPSAYQPQTPAEVGPAVTNASNWPSGNAQWHLAQTVAGASIDDPHLGELTLHSRSAGELIGLAIRFARARFRSLWLATLILVSPVVVVTEFLGSWVSDQASSTTSSLAMLDVQSSSEVATKIFLASAAILFLGFVASVAAATFAIRSTAETMLADLPLESSRIASNKRSVVTSAVFGVGLLTVLTVPVALTAFLGAIALPTLFLTLPLALFVLVFGSLLVVAMLPVALIEGGGLGSTFRRMRTLRRRATGRLLGTIILNRILQWFVVTIISIPLLIVSVFVANETVLFALAVGISLIATVFDVLVTGFALAFWYFDCRIRNEAFDVQVMSAQVSAQVAEVER